MEYHVIEATIRYLTAEEGGRNQGVMSGYRGQFHYGDNDYDGFQFFPDAASNERIELGKEVRTFVRFQRERWQQVHAAAISIGMPFEIREGRRVVGRGVVTSVDVSQNEWQSCIENV